MTDYRFTDRSPIAGPMTQLSTNGFLMIPISPVALTQISPLQLLYQKMLEQALHSKPQPATPDLFTNMN